MAHIITSELMAKYDARQSFYGKAQLVSDLEEKSVTLLSYGTPIAKVYLTDDRLVRLCGAYTLTQTTMRHLREFMKQYDKLGSNDCPNKKQLMEIPYESSEAEAEL